MSRKEIKKVVVKKIEDSQIKETSLFHEKEFIDAIYECELEKHILQQRIESLTQEIDNNLKDVRWESSWQRREYEKEYCSPIIRFPDAPKKPVSFVDFGFFSFVITGLFFGVIAGFIISCLMWIGDSSSFNKAPIIVVALLGAAVFFVLNLYDYLKIKHNYRQYINSVNQVKLQRAAIEKQNQEAKRKWIQDLDLENARNRSSYLDSDEYYKTKGERDVIQKKLTEVSNTLEFLYSLRRNGSLCIHPQYKGLVPISVIHGYFDTGRASSLTGHEGAYNLYESEKLQGIIINKLSDLDSSIAKLNNSMYYVGEAIENCNRTLEQLEEGNYQLEKQISQFHHNMLVDNNNFKEQLATIDGSIDNASYYAEVGAKMATFNAVYNYLKE